MRRTVAKRLQHESAKHPESRRYYRWLKRQHRRGDKRPFQKGK